MPSDNPFLDELRTRQKDLRRMIENKKAVLQDTERELSVLKRNEDALTTLITSESMQAIRKVN